MPPTLDRTLPLSELARAWGWSPHKLYRLCDVNAIPHLRIRGRIYFEVSAVEAWKAARRRAVMSDDEDARRDRATEEAARLGVPPGDFEDFAERLLQEPR